MDYLSSGWLDPGVVPVLLSSASNVSRTQATQLTPRAQLALEVLMVFMCLGAVTGNILVIVIVAATKTFHSVTSVLIINLAVSDLLVGVGVMPFVAVSIMSTSWVDCTDLCLYVGYTSSVYCTASVLTLAAIALDRYHCIMDCLRYSSRCTLWRISAVVLWIWLQALATSCPPLLGWSSVSYVAPMFSCTVNWNCSPSYTAFMAVLSYLLPAAVILFCYVNIVKVARGHAQRIHNLEDYLQRSRQASATSSDLTSVGDSTVEHYGNHHGLSRLVYHLSGQFVSEVRGQGSSLDPALSSSGAPQASSNPASRRLLSFLAHGASTDPQQNSCQQQHHNYHGIVRLFLVISAFFLCWTPYMGVALVQATETALTGKSSLVSPTAITFSYWLLLLNSDINPLLYALLSKRFQGALQNLRQKIRARLGRAVGRVGDGRADGDEGRSSDPDTQTATHPRSTSESSGCESSTSESSGCDESKYCSSIFTVNTSFEHHTEEHVCGVFLPGSASSSSSSSSCRVECLQVPSRTQEGSRLPFSAATKERQATFFYGQITVRVEHDVC